jgi:peroxiredoxin
MTKPLIALLWIAAAGPASAGTPAEAARIRSDYKAAMSEWVERLGAAGSVEQQRTVWQSRPDAGDYVRRMWRSIGAQLDESWTLAPAAWLLRINAALQAVGAGGPLDGGAAEEGGAAAEAPMMISAIREAVEQHHLQSADPGLLDMCLALVEIPDPRSLAILEKIEREHPSARFQGVAALGLSMVLKTLGDEGEVMRRRLSMLREAIIKSADVELGGVTVAKIAEDELYVISHLSKGRNAPELIGRDVAGREMKLSDYKGKVVVLLFWSTGGGDVERLLGMAARLVADHRNAPFALVGVNGDPAGTLRQLVAEGVVDWPNFSDPAGKLAEQYRVVVRPLAIVIDRDGVIRYIGAPGSFVDLTVEAILGGK